MADWERQFRPEEIEYGRTLYKTGAIRSVELDADHAIICARLADGVDQYCVLDFDGVRLVSRPAENYNFILKALSVAGLYEISEIVADAEVSDPEGVLFGDEPAPALASGAQDSEDGGAPIAEGAEEVSGNPAHETRKDRKLFLKFSSSRNGLVFETSWKDSKGRIYRTFGDACVKVSELSEGECACIMKLTNLARKAGFKYEKNRHILRDIPKIAPFLNLSLGEWRKLFEIELEKNVDALFGGEMRVMLNPVARTIDGNTADFDVEWVPSIGGKTVAVADLRKLIGGGTVASSSLKILPKYGIVRISNADTSFINSVERSREFGFADGKIPRYMLLALSDFGNRMELSDDLKAWTDSLVADASKTDSVPMPEFLRNYQMRGVLWAENLFRHDCNAMIADEMGLGKTVQTLSVIMRDIWRSGGSSGAKGGRKYIVVCPASVIPVWLGEAQKFFPQIRCAVLNSKSELSKADLWISSYTQLRRNKAILDGAEFSVAVLDEAQFIKNPDAKTTAACNAIKAAHKLALTGTPVENRLLDMWTSFRWLMPGLMGTRGNFEALVADNPAAVDTVRRQIAPFVLRRMKTQVARELPEKIYIDLLCPMSDLQGAEYAKLLESARESLGNVSDAKGRFTVLSLLTRLRQAACDASLLPWVGHTADAGGKLTVLCEKVDELVAGGKKVLIFSQFTKFLDIIRSSLAMRIGSDNIITLTGATRDRTTPVASFQNAKGARVMLVSLRAGGTGITLTAADYVFMADPWWNPAVEEQAIDRVHRIGRNGDVFVYRLFAQGTVEDRVRLLQQKKRNIFDSLVGDLGDVSNQSAFVKTVSDILG